MGVTCPCGQEFFDLVKMQIRVREMAQRVKALACHPLTTCNLSTRVETRDGVRKKAGSLEPAPGVGSGQTQERPCFMMVLGL